MRKTAVTPLSPLALPPLLARHWLGRPHAPRHVGSPRVDSQPRRKLRCLDIRCDAPLSNRTHHAQPPCPAIRGPYPVGVSLAADRLGLHGWAAGHLRRLESRPASDQTRSQPRMIRRGWLGRPCRGLYPPFSPHRRHKCEAWSHRWRVPHDASIRSVRSRRSVQFRRLACVRGRVGPCLCISVGCLGYTVHGRAVCVTRDGGVGAAVAYDR